MPFGFRLLALGVFRRFLPDGFPEIGSEGRRAGHDIGVMGVEPFDGFVHAFDVFRWIILRVRG